MKRIALILLATTICYAKLTAQELNYFKGSWAEAQQKAKIEKKYLFVDAYTEWCGWCKVMDKETFKDAKVVAFIEKNFIPVKIDMEHGEGVLIAMKYHISVFPTFMFFTPKGEYVYSSAGYEKAEPFMKTMQSAMEKKSQFHAPGFSPTLNVAFPEFYKEAYLENGKKKIPKTEEVVAFLDAQKDLFDEVSWGIMARFDAGEKYNTHFLDNLKKYSSLYGEESVNTRLDKLLNRKLKVAIEAKSESQLNDLLALADKNVKKDLAQQKAIFKIQFYGDVQNWPGLSAAMDDYISVDKYENTGLINSISWNLYEQCNDAAILNKATSWMAIAVKNEPKYAIMDTYAALLYKTKQWKAAEEWAAKAIETGKKAGEKVEGTEKLLEKIKAEKGN